MSGLTVHKVKRIEPGYKGRGQAHANYVRTCAVLERVRRNLGLDYNAKFSVDARYP